MTRSANTPLSPRTPFGVALLATILWAGIPLSAQAQVIEGPWLMTVTLRDCATSTPLGPPFLTLITFHAGGTLSESAASAGFAPGQRGPGHGSWNRTGPSTFSGRFAALVSFETAPNPPNPGFRAGGLVVTSAFSLTGPDQLTATATADFYDLALTKYRAACPTSVGTRFR